MKRFSVVFYLIVVSLVFSACGGGKDNSAKKMAESHYKMSLSHFNENNITAALRELLRAYEYDPENFEVNHLLGIAYIKKKDYANAEKHLKKAIRINSDLSRPYNNLGIVFLETKRYDDAIEQFNKAIGNILYETPEFAYTNLGWAYYKKGDFVQAQKAYEKSIELETRYSLAHYNYGILLFDLEKYDDAINEYKEAIKFFPNYLEAWYNMGMTYFKIKDNVNAKKSFDKVVEIAPDSEKAELAKGYLDLLK